METNARLHPAFTPVGLGKFQLRNRLAVAPMSRVRARMDGMPTAEMAEGYGRYAEGGFSLIITEGIYTDDDYSQAYPLQPGLVTGAQVEGWRRVTEAVHARGGVILAQLMHAGALSQHLSRTIAPSAVQPKGRMMADYGGGGGAFLMPGEMDVEDIGRIIDGFVGASLHAVQAGFDGVEVHAANGYLLDQALTPHLNLRTDKYGGSVGGRCRLVGEIMEGIRGVLPGDRIVGLRLSEGKVNDLGYRWPEGAAMAREVLKEVRLMGPDYVHIAAERGDWGRDCRYVDGSSYGGLAKEIVGVPVVANGGLHRLDVAEEVLNGGHGDVLALGKAALGDAFWPVRMLAGMEDTGR